MVVLDIRWCHVDSGVLGVSNLETSRAKQAWTCIVTCSFLALGFAYYFCPCEGPVVDGQTLGLDVLHAGLLSSDLGS